MTKLTPKRAAALKAICDRPGKSGAYWRSAGHAPATLAWLEANGYADGKSRDFFQNSILRYAWYPTKKGQTP